LLGFVGRYSPLLFEIIPGCYGALVRIYFSYLICAYTSASITVAFDMFHEKKKKKEKMDFMYFYVNPKQKRAPVIRIAIYLIHYSGIPVPVTGRR